MAPVTCTLMAFIFICSCTAFYRPALFIKLILHPFGIFHNKEYYRIFTSDFVHNDWLHLAMNELMLYMMCVNLEEYLRSLSKYGSLQFFCIYFSSYFSGIIYTTIRYRNKFEYSSAGASGSIIGCMISFMMIRPDYMALYFPIIGGVKNMYMALLFIIVLIYYQRRSGNTMIANELHFFGALGGMIATLVIAPKSFQHNIAGADAPAIVYHQPRQEGPVAARMAPATAPAPPNNPPKEADTPML
jgi:membrane associated rhomboid family serine protease